MRSTSWIILLMCAGCTAHVAPTLTPSKVTAQASLQAPPPPASSQGSETPAVPPEQPAEAALAQVVAAADASAQPADVIPDGVDEEAAAADDDEPVDAVDTDEGEAQEIDPSAVPSGPLYTAELSDEQLTEMWKKEPTSLGSISVGFVESGRMVNSVRFPQPQGEDWLVVSPELAWGTQETVDYLAKAIREVRAKYPKAPPLRVNQLSSREGGYLRPHKSHQNGRDVDLGFYYPTAEPIREREREKYIDVELNWALVKALAIHTDVQMILVDKRVQKVLYDHALRNGEDKAWLDSLFNAGAKSLVKHARRHRDHFHVRFFNPRAQELGRRVAPLLALQPDKNIMMHRIRSGDTLGGIALRYGSSVQTIKKANRMRGILLRIGQVLAVPLRGPCTRCPLPPPLVVPPRRLPPTLEQAPAVAVEQAPAPAQPQPSVAAQETPVPAQQDTGGSASDGADAPAETPSTLPETTQQHTGEGSPAGADASNGLTPVGPAASR